MPQTNKNKVYTIKSCASIFYRLVSFRYHSFTWYWIEQRVQYCLGINRCNYSCPNLLVIFSTCCQEQKGTAEKLKLKSLVKFDNCVGCINGMLIWMSNPSPHTLKVAMLGRRNFSCGRKQGWTKCASSLRSQTPVCCC